MKKVLLVLSFLSLSLSYLLPADMGVFVCRPPEVLSQLSFKAQIPETQTLSYITNGNSWLIIRKEKKGLRVDQVRGPSTGWSYTEGESHTNYCTNGPSTNLSLFIPLKGTQIHGWVEEYGYFRGEKALKGKYFYRNGSIQGTSFYYYQAQLQVKSTWKHGLLDGWSMAYDGKSLEQKSLWNAGKLLEIQSFRFGKLQSHYRYAWTNSTEYTTFQHFYENGNLSHTGMFKDDQNHGIYRQYYPNGQIEYECVYSNGIQIDPDR